MIREEDARTLVRILSKVAAMEGSHEDKKRVLMEDLCKAVSADYWAWALATDLSVDSPAVYTSISTGGFGESQMAKWMDALNHPDSWEYSKAVAREVIENWVQVTRLREDHDPENSFPESDGAKAWKAADVGFPLVCYRPVANGCVSAIGLYRRFDRPEFTRREAKMVHIILTEVDWLHEQGWPWESALKVPQLPKRCQTALTLLLEGQPRKQIASDMGISVHTRNGYVKQIYQTYGVHSHAELLNRFLVGDGGDVPAKSA
jgi:DNA-binding CsgD family transcriptional regulator